MRDWERTGSMSVYNKRRPQRAQHGGWMTVIMVVVSRQQGGSSFGAARSWRMKMHEANELKKPLNEKKKCPGQWISGNSVVLHEKRISLNYSNGTIAPWIVRHIHQTIGILAECIPRNFQEFWNVKVTRVHSQNIQLYQGQNHFPSFGCLSSYLCQGPQKARNKIIIIMNTNSMHSFVCVCDSRLLTRWHEQILDLPGGSHNQTKLCRTLHQIQCHGTLATKITAEPWGHICPLQSARIVLLNGGICTRV